GGVRSGGQYVGLLQGRNDGHQALRCAGSGKNCGAPDIGARVRSWAKIAPTSSATPPADRKGPNGWSMNATEIDTPSIASPTIHVGVAQQTTQKSVAFARPASPMPITAVSVEPAGVRLQRALRAACSTPKVARRQPVNAISANCGGRIMRLHSAMFHCGLM